MFPWQPSMQSPASSAPSTAWEATLDRLFYNIVVQLVHTLLLVSCQKVARKPLPFPFALQESRVLFSSLTMRASTMEWLILQTRCSFCAGGSRARRMLPVMPGFCSPSLPVL